MRNSNQPLTEHRSEVSQSDFAIFSLILDNALARNSLADAIPAVEIELSTAS